MQSKGYRLKLITQKIRVLKNLIMKHPILTVFDVTKLCNERCPMCNIWKTESNDMDIEQIKVRARQLAKFGCGYVYLQGGDPLMRCDIIEICDIFLSVGIRPTIITNGIRLTKELGEEISKRPINLAISIDTLIPKRYALLRGVDALATVERNIEEIKDISHKGNWSITTTVTKQTELDDVKNMIKYAREKGFMYAVRPYITVEGKAGKKNENLSYKEDNESVLKIFYYAYRRAAKENFIASMIYKEHISYIKGEKMPACDALRYSFLMKEDGGDLPV